ncbi:MAG: hypothetical protein LCH41_01760 [Armatimonadetes bacterium]|nr:hypothetical protein [Armatimonadota bacterium]
MGVGLVLALSWAGGALAGADVSGFGGELSPSLSPREARRGRDLRVGWFGFRIGEPNLRDRGVSPISLDEIAEHTKGTVSVQTFTQDLTPPELLPLGGYTARNGALAQPGGEKLGAHILVLSQGRTKVALVACEMLTIPESLRKEVASRIWPEAQVLLVATHTHCAPDSQMLNERMTFRIPGIAPFNRRWLDWYAARIAGGIRQALDQKPVPKSLLVTRGFSEMVRSRRKGVPVDQSLYTLRDDAGNKLLMTFGAHATLFDETELTPQGDWPGRLMGLTGGLVFPGAIGNASPAPPDDPSPAVRASTMARNLFDEPPFHSFAVDVLRWESEAISLPTPIPHPEFAAANKVNDGLAQLVVSRFAPPAARLSVVRLGNTLLIGVPGEPSTPVARMLEETARKHGFQAIVVSHANGWVGYILDPEDYKRGGYEATLMFHGPDLSLRLNEALARLIGRL